MEGILGSGSCSVPVLSAVSKQTHSVAKGAVWEPFSSGGFHDLDGVQGVQDSDSAGGEKEDAVRLQMGDPERALVVDGEVRMKQMLKDERDRSNLF